MRLAVPPAVVLLVALTESEWSTYLADLGPYQETCS